MSMMTSGVCYGNGSTKTITFDSRYRPTENKLTTATSVIADYVYQNDPAGNITQIHDTTNATYNRDFGYNDLNRLKTLGPGLRFMVQARKHLNRRSLSDVAGQKLGGTSTGSASPTNWRCDLPASRSDLSAPVQ